MQSQEKEGTNCGRRTGSIEGEQLAPPKRRRCSGSKALAVETAALVSQEVQPMQESIAELENLLAFQEEEEEEQQ
jgi:hypothetical protein